MDFGDGYTTLWIYLKTIVSYTISSVYYGMWLMRNAGLDEVQAGIKMGGRNINNLQ